MPRSTIEMKALIKTTQKERFQELHLEKTQLAENKRRDAENKKKNLQNMLTMNPFIRLFVLSKIK